MKRFLPLILLALAGCASVQYAGTASYSVQPIVVNGQTVCCAVDVKNGKEIAQLDALINKQGENYQVQLHEVGVAAFQGQRIAAEAGKVAAADAAQVATVAALAPILPAVLPAAGAALAAPGIGAAVVGAGAALGAQKLMSSPATIDSGKPLN
jgi:hypothetical protein